MAKTKLSPEQQAAFGAVERQLPGYWTTAELSTLLQVGVAAVWMLVSRGKLNPVSRKYRQDRLFADAEVIRYLSRPRGNGRPPRHTKTAPALPYVPLMLRETWNPSKEK